MQRRTISDDTTLCWWSPQSNYPSVIKRLNSIDIKLSKSIETWLELNTFKVTEPNQRTLERIRLMIIVTWWNAFIAFDVFSTLTSMEYEIIMLLELSFIKIRLINSSFEWNERKRIFNSHFTGENIVYNPVSGTENVILFLYYIIGILLFMSFCTLQSWNDTY